MMPLTELGMTDIASRSRNGPVWKVGGVVALLVVLYAALRNYLYVEGGMLAPNFDVIHKAYDFNLWHLPWLLLGVAAFFAVLALTLRGIRRALLWLAIIYAFIAVDLFALRYYVTYVEPERLIVRRVRLETPKLTRPVRLLHISDIQAGSIGPYQVEIFEKIKALHPDLILNTGDFLQVVPPATFDGEWKKLLSLIREVNPRFGTYGVFGDTERELYHIHPDDMAPLVILSSNSASIDVGGGVLSLLGLSLYESRSGDWAMRSIEQWLAQSAGSDFRILLGHAPDYALSVGGKPIDLCLAGHTHGGQVCLPWYGPPVVDSKVPREWSGGFRRIGIPYLNVSVGAGSNRFHGLPPLRFNCPTEMTLIELVPIRPIR